MNERNFDIAEKLTEIARKMETTPATLAIAWILQRPMISSVIIGPKSVDQLQDNFAACDVRFDDDDLNAITRLSRPRLGYPEKFIMHNARNSMRF